MELRDYIIAKLQSKRLSQRDLADAVKRDPSTVSNWLKGNYAIPIDAIEDIAAALDERTPFKLYRLAGLFAGQPLESLIAALDGEAPETIMLVERVARALLQKENQHP